MMRVHEERFSGRRSRILHVVRHRCFHADWRGRDRFAKVGTVGPQIEHRKEIAIGFILIASEEKKIGRLGPRVIVLIGRGGAGGERHREAHRT